MAVAENAGARIGSVGGDVEIAEKGTFEEEKPAAAVNSNGNDLRNGFDEENRKEMVNEVRSVENGGNGGILKKGMSDLAEMLSKLNPMAEEFIPPSLANHQNVKDNGSAENGKKRSKKYGQAKRKLKKKTSNAQRADAIRNTVYVTDIGPQVTEEALAGLFLSCGPIVDCRICSVPISSLRFAFIEFHDKEDAKAALNLSGTVLGVYPLKVLPSKTAIAPVNPTFLPKSDEEREMCSRTIYCTNIHKKVTRADAKLFFESCCGEVRRLKLLEDAHHPTHSAFVEFRTGSPIKDACSPPCPSPCSTLSHPCFSSSPRNHLYTRTLSHPCFSSSPRNHLYSRTRTLCDTAVESTFGVDVILLFLCPSSVQLLLAAA